MPIKQFLQQVTSYIRSKEARRYVEVELQQHIAHSKEAWMNKGYSAEEAEQKAIAEMGSASQLGKSMDKIHRPKWDFWLIGAVLLLVAASFVPILTIQHVQFGKEMTSYLLERKIIHIVVAIGLIIALVYMDYRKFQKFSMPIYVVAVFLLLLMLFMPNLRVNGEAMLKIGPLRIQVWTVLPILLVAFAGFFAEHKCKGWHLTGLFVVPLLLIMMIPNPAVALFYIVVVAILFSFSYFTRKQKRYVGFVSGGIALATLAYGIYAYYYLFAWYQKERIAAFLQPELHMDSSGFFILRLKSALANAGWFGSQTPIYFPEAYTDYALVQLIQTYGYVAGILVIGVILAIALRILWMIRTMPQSFGKLLVLAAVTLYSCQSVYSILMIVGLLPLAGIPLPFISYGFIPLVLNAFLIGLVLSVYRRKSYVGKQALSA